MSDWNELSASPSVRLSVLLFVVTHFFFLAGGTSLTQFDEQLDPGARPSIFMSVRLVYLSVCLYFALSLSLSLFFHPSQLISRIRGSDAARRYAMLC